MKMYKTFSGLGSELTAVISALMPLAKAKSHGQVEIQGVGKSTPPMTNPWKWCESREDKYLGPKIPSTH